MRQRQPYKEDVGDPGSLDMSPEHTRLQPHAIISSYHEKQQKSFWLEYLKATGPYSHKQVARANSGIGVALSFTEAIQEAGGGQ